MLLGMFTFQWSEGMATMYPDAGVVAAFGPGRSVVVPVHRSNTFRLYW